MKNIQSLGIQMAQSDISLSQARGLGLITYLAFIKVKAEQQRAHFHFSDQNISGYSTDCDYSKLYDSIEDLLSKISDSIRQNQSTSIITLIDSYISDGLDTERETLSWELIHLLNVVDSNARSLIVDPIDSFINRIAAVQALGAIQSFQSHLELEKLNTANSIELILKRLKGLTLKTNFKYKASRLLIA